MTIELAKAKQILVSKIGDMLVDGDLQSFLSSVLSALSLKLEDAPSDGKQYSREDGTWSEVVIPTPDVTEAPIDGKQYVRQDASWEEVSIPTQGVEEAPADGKTYGRKDEDWVEVTGGGGGGDSGDFKIPLWHFYQSSQQSDIAAIQPRCLVNGVLFDSNYKYSKDGYFWNTTTGTITGGSNAPVVMFYHEGLDAYLSHYDSSSGLAAIKNPENPDSTGAWVVSGGSSANRCLHPVLDGSGTLFHPITGGVASIPLAAQGVGSISIGAPVIEYAFSNSSYNPRGAGYCPITGKIMLSAGLGGKYDTLDSSFDTNQDPGKIYITSDSFDTVTEVSLPSGVSQIGSIGYSSYYKCFFFSGVVSYNSMFGGLFNIYKIDVSGPSPVFTKIVDGYSSAGDKQYFNFNFVENVVGFEKLISYDGENFQFSEDMGSWLQPRHLSSPGGFYFKPTDSAKLSQRPSRQFFNIGEISNV